MSDILFGRVSGYELTQAANGTKDVAKVQVKTDDGGAHIMQLVLSSGEDNYPPVGTRAAFIRSGGAYLCIGLSDMLAQVMNVGDKEIYSQNSGGTSKQARHKLKANGKHYIANAAAGKDLRSALDSLSGALDTFSNSAATSAITAGAATSASLAAALVTLFGALNISVASAKAAIDAVLDNAP